MEGMGGLVELVLALCVVLGGVLELRSLRRHKKRAEREAKERAGDPPP